MSKRLRILLRKWFDTPEFLVGDRVIVWPERIKGVVALLDHNGAHWTYYVVFMEPVMLGGYLREGWWLGNTSLTRPFMDDLVNWGIKMKQSHKIKNS